MNKTSRALMQILVHFFETMKALDEGRQLTQLTITANDIETLLKPRPELKSICGHLIDVESIRGLSPLYRKQDVAGMAIKFYFTLYFEHYQVVIEGDSFDSFDSQEAKQQRWDAIRTAHIMVSEMLVIATDTKTDTL